MEIRFLSVGCADGIHILYSGLSGDQRHLLIDGGVERGDIYPTVLRKELAEIATNKEQIDLWIITHIDDDHIGGLLRFLHDTPLRESFNLLETEIWYNYTEADYVLRLQKSQKKGVAQGIRLREYLRSESRLNEDLTNQAGSREFGPLRLTLLSPSPEKLEQLKKDWQKEEAILKSASRKKLAKASDYHKPLADFDLSQQTTDPSSFNGSSIACLLESGNHRVLLTADSHPDTIYNSLLAKGYANEDGKRLVLDYMQLAHHGSEANTSAALLGIIECSNFIISANGIKHNLPNKALIARLIACYPGKKLTIYLTHSNTLTRSILTTDLPLENLEIVYPAAGQNFIRISL